MAAVVLVESFILIELFVVVIEWLRLCGTMNGKEIYVVSSLCRAYLRCAPGASWLMAAHLPLRLPLGRCCCCRARTNLAPMCAFDVGAARRAFSS